VKDAATQQRQQSSGAQASANEAGKADATGAKKP